MSSFFHSSPDEGARLEAESHQQQRGTSTETRAATDCADEGARLGDHTPVLFGALSPFTCFDSSEDEARQWRRIRPLRDADGVYYVGGTATVCQHVVVEQYATARPLIPVEELRASSVQHPMCPACRWLMHSCSVPARPQETGGASHPAGIADSVAARGAATIMVAMGAAQPVSEPGPDSSALPRCAGVRAEESNVRI